jgi:flagellar biosynthetic protein FliQ
MTEQAASVSQPVARAAVLWGIVVGLVQAATSVNEQTLTFVPKLVVTALVLVLFGGAMMALIGDFTNEIFAQIAKGGGAS